METDEVTPEDIFILAFDVMVQDVHQKLASAGLAEEEIWAAFRRGMAAIVDHSQAVEHEQPERAPVALAEPMSIPAAQSRRKRLQAR